MSWKDRIKELTSKLNKACYVTRLIKPLVSLNVLRMIYFCCVRSFMSYSIIFWGNSYHSKCIFIIQKRIISVIMNTNKRYFCHELFKQLNILPLQSQYILSMLIFISKNRDLFMSNLEIYRMVSVQDVTLISTYLQLPWHYSRKVSSVQEVGFLIT